MGGDVMKRFIPYYEISVFGTIAVLALLATLSLTFFMPEYNLPVIVAFGAVCGGILIFCGTMIIQKYFAPPDYITRQGTHVWTEIRKRTYFIPTLTDVERFIDTYIEYAPEVFASSQELQSTERSITSQQLIRMFKDLNILFTQKRSALSGMEWWVRDAGCAQRKNLIAVRYFAPFTATHIFHVLHHAIDAQVLDRDPDPGHKNEAWWEVLEKIQTKVEEKLYGISTLSISKKN
jgi:hypothetical protein